MSLLGTLREWLLQVAFLGDLARDPYGLIVVLQQVSFALIVVGSIFLVRRRHSARFAGITFLVSITMACAMTVAFPVWTLYYPTNPSTFLFASSTVVCLLCVNLAAWLVPRAEAARLLGALGSRPHLYQVGLSAMAMIIPMGVVESAAQVTTRFGVVPYFVPVETRAGARTEDWRLSHIMDDNLREPDPLLLWRSVPRYPYSAQRFKGPELAVPKPRGLFRIICYGDSNTDGPSRGHAYADRLQAILDAKAPEEGARRHEVVNAGVGGYSSYQGLLRFKEEVDQFSPDLVLMSFGWNDVTDAIGHPDKEFAHSGLLPTSSHLGLMLRRLVLNYRSLLVAQHFITQGAPVAQSAVMSASSAGTTPAVVSSPRVELADFENNLRTFIQDARDRGIVPVLMTRPTRDAPEVLRQNAGWRKNVPSYNEATLKVARESDVLAIDVQRAFQGHPEKFFDECHFTNEGHQEMAQLIHTELRKAGYLN